MSNTSVFIAGEHPLNHLNSFLDLVLIRRWQTAFVNPLAGRLRTDD